MRCVHFGEKQVITESQINVYFVCMITSLMLHYVKYHGYFIGAKPAFYGLLLTVSLIEISHSN